MYARSKRYFLPKEMLILLTFLLISFNSTNGLKASIWKRRYFQIENILRRKEWS